MKQDNGNVNVGLFELIGFIRNPVNLFLHWNVLV